MKRKPNTKRPGRGTKGEHTKLLPPQLQGRHYRVVEFRVQPIVALYDADGVEENRIAAQPEPGQFLSVSIFESKFKSSMIEIMEANNLKMEGGKP